MQNSAALYALMPLCISAYSMVYMSLPSSQAPVYVTYLISVCTRALKKVLLELEKEHLCASFTLKWK